MLDNYCKRVGTIRTILVFGLIYLVSLVTNAVILHPLDSLLFFKAQTTFSKTEYLGYLHH